MGRPTLATQLAKAAADGDLEKVKELAARLGKSEPKKSRAKSKPKSRSKVEVYEEELYQPEEEDDIEPSKVEPHVRSYDDCVAPARKSNHRETYIDENGEERVRSRIVPFKIVKNRKNTWKDDLQVEAGDIEFDKLVHKNGTTRQQHRPPTTKVKVRCSRCKSVKVVWPGEVLHRNWSCDDCLTSNKPG